MMWPITGIAFGILCAAAAGLVWSAFAAINTHQLQTRVLARERAARKINRLLQRRPQLEFLLQAAMVGGICLGTAAASTLQPVMSVRGGVLLGAVLVLMLAAVQLGIRGGRVYHERISTLTSHVLLPTLRLLRPMLELILPDAQTKLSSGTAVSAADALRAVIAERQDLASGQARMLRGVLDLEQMRVGEIMIPRSDIVGIDVESNMDDIAQTVRNARHTRMPVFSSDINSVVGIVHARDLHEFIASDAPTRAELLTHAVEPYYVPQGTQLRVLLRNMQRDHRRLALVVDEYGDVQGLVTVDDVLEQIVGEYTTDFTDTLNNIVADEHGGHIIDASLLLRDINRELNWQLPIAGPRTLNGLILEHLEFIPDANVGLEIAGYRIEILAVRENTVRRARVTPKPESGTLDDV